MHTSRCLAVFLAAICSTLVLCAGAQAARVTVGSPLVGEFIKAETNGSGTAAGLTLPEAGAHATSPVNGVVVGFNLLDAEGGPFRLRVLRPVGGPTYTAVGSSAPVTASGSAFFPTALPVQVGDLIGLDVSGGSFLGILLTPSATAADWIPPIVEGASTPWSSATPGGEFGFNALIQPAPAIGALSTAEGSIAGGTQVTVTGTDFEGASAVSFGSTPAASFTVSNEGTITATAPASKTIANVPVTVTTIAGTATSTATFAYQGCKIPNLTGKKLKAAKKKLKAADCKLGAVTKKEGATANSGKVKKQGPKAGKVLAPGSKVKVTLKP